MKKSILLGLLIVLTGSLLVGCNKTKTPTVDEPTSLEDQTVGEVVQEWQRVGQAIATGQSVKCTMTQVENGETSHYYIKGTQIRFDTISTTSPDQTTSLLSDGEFVYTWGDGARQGLKFSALNPSQSPQQPEVESPSNAPDFSTQEAWNSYRDLGYTIQCDVTSVDPALFVPPSDITFMDMSALTQPLAPDSNSTNSGQTGINPAVGELDEAQLQQLMKQFGGAE